MSTPVPGYGCGLARDAFFECWGELATDWQWPASALFDAHGDDGKASNVAPMRSSSVRLLSS